MFQEAMKSFHHLDHGDVRALVDELMVSIGSVGPAPGIGEGVELRLAYFATGLPEEDVIIGVRIKRRIEIDEIDAGIGELFRVPQPAEVIAEIKSIHQSRDSHSPALRASSRLRSE